jgi:3-oxoadipate enol-lactonase
MRVQLSGISLEYDDSGPVDSSRPTILFIHGYPLNRKIWQAQVNGLSKFARVLALDLRGFGESDASPGPYSMESLADDCITLLDQLNIIDPVVICGLSMGGYISLALYKKYSHRVQGLILSSTRSGADSPEAKASRDKAIALVEKEGVQAIARLMLPKMFAPDSYLNHPDRVEALRKMMLSASVSGIQGVLAGMRDRPDSTPFLSSIFIPTLLIFGELDQFVEQTEVKSMLAAIPNAQLRFIPNTGHLLNLEQPVEYNRLVRDFLRIIPEN